jgi:uncharacterized protein (TIRG00374 family)
MKKKIVLVVGLAITVFALWYTTRGVDWKEFARSLGRVHWLWIAPALAAFYYSMYLRAVRWGLLFRPHHQFSGARMFKPIMICFAFNSILPGRVGEVARAYYVGKRMETGISTALATVLAERIFDGVCLLGILGVSLMMLKLPTDQTFSFGTHTMNVSQGITILTRLSLVLTVGVIVFMIPAVQRLMVQIVRRLPLLPGGLKHKLETLVGQFARGFHALAKPAVLAQIVFQSIVLWLLVGISNWCVGLGFGLPMNALHGCALMTLIGIFILIPAAPGYWGLYEAGGVFSMVTLLHVTDDKAVALAYTLMIHLVQYIPIVIVGLIFAAQAQVKADVVAAESTSDDAPANAATKSRA